MLIEKKVARILISSRKTLSVAESCTGGLLTHRLTNIPGSSQFLKTGFIVYSNDAKIKFLKIPPKILQIFGAVSEQTALAMAKMVRKISKTDIGLAITGIAGPAGGTRTKPVGLTFIAVSTPKQTQCREYHFKGTRTQIKSQAATQALRLLSHFLSEN